MRGLVRTFAYLAITGGCVAAISAGAAYLIAPDGAGPVAREPAPIPPRLAASIERRIVLPPHERPIPVLMEPAPVMQQAAAALPVVSAPAQRKPDKRVRARRAARQDALRRSQLAAQNHPAPDYRSTAVTTARSDVPY